MIRSNLSNMVVTVLTLKTLETLRENKERHVQIVKEAREGYIKSAKEALAARMDKLESGEVVSLSFTLTPPQDYSKIYDVAIRMLDMHTENTIELDGTQVQHLVMDEWDWQQGFLTSNTRYSKMANDYTLEKGY